MNQMPKIFYTKTTPTGVVADAPVTLSTLLILQAADELGVGWRILPGTNIFELSYKNQIKHFYFQVSTETTNVAMAVANDKNLTNNLWRAAGVQAPTGYFLSRKDTKEYWLEVFHSLQKPLVVKPTYGVQGKAVYLGITDTEAYCKAVEQAFNFSTDKYAGVLVEQTCPGNEYRILLTREKVLGIVYRRPANVVGDGVHTIEELILEKNKDPKRGTDDTYALFQIQIDDDVRETLKVQDKTLQYVPKKDERVFVRRVSNIARGGDSIDITDSVHSSVKELALQAIRAIPGLAFAGLDMMTTDITKDQATQQYAFIEINESPGFCIQAFPAEGTPRMAQYDFLQLAFPDLKIPQ